MTDDIIPDDVRQFIVDKIDSVIQLEALLLFQADAQAVWDAGTLGARLYIEGREAAALLELMQARSFIAAVEPGRFQYRPAAAAQTMERVAETYRRALIPVTRLIHAKPKIQRFADAFRIRKDRS